MSNTAKAAKEILVAQAIIAAAERSTDNIAALGNAVIRHQELYDAGTPAISDADFDRMVTVLRRLAPKSAVLEHLGKPAGGKRKVAHTSPMLSLAKCYDKTEIVDWCIEAGVDTFQIGPKYDGVSLSLIYDRGRLVDAVTRGDGKAGDSVLHNVLVMQGAVPNRLSGGPDYCVIRGEAIFSKTAWAKVKPYFEARAAKREGSVNARNAAAGILQAKRPNDEVLRQLDFIAYDCLSADSAQWTLGSALRQVMGNDFTTGHIWTAPVKQAMHFLDLAAEHAAQCDYETDGVVVKVDAYADRERLGATSHHPKWAIALKFQGGSGATVLRSVQWQVSRTGTVTPVGIVDPIELSGATITRVTLHNLKQIETLGLREGCAVKMTRRGGVIPHIEHALNVPMTPEIRPPKKCPCCKGPVVRDSDFLKCVNSDECPDVQRQRLLFWAQQTDMMGWGEEVISKLYDAGDVIQPSELYTNKRALMITMFGKGLGPKLMREAEVKRTMTPAVFLRALGLEGIGGTQSEKILEHFRQDVGKLLDWADEPAVALNIAGIGEALTGNLHTGINQARGEIRAALNVVNLIVPQKCEVRSGPFAGKKIVFTGKLSDIEREAARALVRTHGAETPAGVTKATDMLVVGDGAKEEQRTKRDKAEKYGVRIVTESEFLEMLAEATDLQT